MPINKKIRKKVVRKSKPLNISDEGKFLIVLEQMRDEIKKLVDGHFRLINKIDAIMRDKGGKKYKAQ